MVHKRGSGGGGQGGRNCASKGCGGGGQGVVGSRVEVVGVKGWWSRVVEVKVVG